MFGLCLERKPWLLIVEYMEYKDLAGVIRNIKKLSLPVRINELLVFPVQIAAGGAYLAEVRVAFYYFFKILCANFQLRNELSIARSRLETS